MLIHTMGQLIESIQAMNLPKYKCHKTVQADKIVNIEYSRIADTYDLTLECGQVITVDKKFVARALPSKGDYYIVYEDGYKSWSPKEAFEGGYTRIDGISTFKVTYDSDDEPKPPLTDV